MAKRYHNWYIWRRDRGLGLEVWYIWCRDRRFDPEELYQGNRKKKEEKKEKQEPGPKPQAAKELDRRDDPAQEPGTRQSAVQVGHFFGFPHLYYCFWESARRVG